MESDHGHFYWNELMAADVEKAKTFYAATLGWSYEDMPMTEGSYTIIKQGEELVGGMMTMPPDMPANAPPHWFSYIAVDDVDARCAKVAGAGGVVLRPAFDVEGVGRIAIVQDPAGAVIGWITPAEADDYEE